MGATIVAVVAMGVAIVAAAICIYLSCEWAFAVADIKPLSTDQILAALAVIVTILGLVIGVVAIGFALMAIFGWTELKAALLRRGEEQVARAIERLRKSGVIGDAEAMVLREEIDQQGATVGAPAEPTSDVETVPAGESTWDVKSYPVTGATGAREGSEQNGDSGTKA
ncbi:MAG: hypothetical protein ACLP00_26150 [Terracidiphilus sp.]